MRAGAGNGLLPRSTVLADIAASHLVALGAADLKVELCFVHASTCLRSSKVAAFVKFLADATGEEFVKCPIRADTSKSDAEADQRLFALH